MRLYNPENLQREEIKDTDEEIAKALSKGLVPSVTQILSMIHSGEHLTRWMIKNSLEHYEKTGDLLKSLDYRDNTASDYGTTCHALVEEYLDSSKKCEEDFNEKHVETVQPFLRWIDNNVKEVIFTETYFADGELKYGGTADFLLRLNSGELLLGDLKCKKHSYKFPMHPSLEYKYQLSAYRNHFQKTYGEMQIGNFLVANLNNPYHRGGAILIPFIYRDQDWTRGFEAAKYLWWEKYAVHE